MNGTDPGGRDASDEVTVGRAAKLVGVPTEALRALCESGSLRARRGDRGHFYLRTAVLPDRAWVEEQTRAGYRAGIRAAQEAMAALDKELEAVRLDLIEAAEQVDSPGVLGNDLKAFGSTFGAFDHAQRDLFGRLVQLSNAHTRLRALLDSAGPGDTGRR